MQQGKRSSLSKLPKKIMLVDGYNVLRAGGKYGRLAQDAPDHAQDAFNAAREALLNDVASFAGREYAATVVFDGAGNPGSAGVPQTFGTITYVFSPHGVTADSVIEHHASMAVKEGKEVLVVSSDANIQWTVFSGKVVRMSAAGFCEEIEALNQSLAQSKAPSLDAPAIKNTLAERIDPKTRAALERFARKKS